MEMSPIYRTATELVREVRQLDQLPFEQRMPLERVAEAMLRYVQRLEAEQAEWQALCQRWQELTR